MSVVRHDTYPVNKYRNIPVILRKYGTYVRNSELFFLDNVIFSPATILGINAHPNGVLLNKNGSFIKNVHLNEEIYFADYYGIYGLDPVYHTNTIELRFSEYDYFMNLQITNSREINYIDLGLFNLTIDSFIDKERNDMFFNMRTNDGDFWYKAIGIIDKNTLDINILFNMREIDEDFRFIKSFKFNDLFYVFASKRLPSKHKLFIYNRYGSLLNEIDISQKFREINPDKDPYGVRAFSDNKYIYIIVNYRYTVESEFLNVHSLIYIDKYSGQLFIDKGMYKSLFGIAFGEAEFLGNFAYDKFNNRILYNGTLIEQDGVASNGYKMAHAFLSGSISP